LALAAASDLNKGKLETWEINREGREEHQDFRMQDDKAAEAQPTSHPAALTWCDFVGHRLLQRRAS
jgi:hypothetical protein